MPSYFLDVASACFAAMREQQDTFYARDRDKGVNFDLLIAIEIARLGLASAQDAQERGTALNDLGNALNTLGERESGNSRLEEAVAAYRAALTERTRERVPLDWAKSHGIFARGNDQSALMPANFTTLAHFSVSSAMNFPKSSGVIGVGTPPRSASRSLIPGSARPVLISLLSLSTISMGVFLGAFMPNQVLAS